MPEEIRVLGLVLKRAPGNPHHYTCSEHPPQVSELGVTHISQWGATVSICGHKLYAFGPNLDEVVQSLEEKARAQLRWLEHLLSWSEASWGSNGQSSG